MSDAKRAYDLLRGYVNREFDRLRGIDLWEAERELDSPATRTPQTTEPQIPQSIPEDQDALARRVLGVSESAGYEEIHKAYEQLRSRCEPGNFPAGSPEQAHATELARKIEAAYQRLTESVPTTEKRFRTLEIE